jgi:exosortase
MFERLQSWWKQHRPSTGVIVASCVLATLFLIVYGYGLHRLFTIWLADQDYQHGFIVPLFSLFLLWHRRSALGPTAERGSWWAAPCFGAWALMRFNAAYFNYQTLDEYSMILFLLGVVLVVGGWQAFVWAWPAIVFLFFMMPLPAQLSVELALKLQHMATVVSVFLLQMVGIAALSQGNVILLPSSDPLEVARQCSGLRMMMMFFAICVGAAFVIRTPRWEKVVMILSAVPIAVICNIARIALTAVQREVLAWEWLDRAAHDMAGWMMMPVAILMLWGELTLLWRLFPEPEEIGVFLSDPSGRLAAYGRSLAGPGRR